MSSASQKIRCAVYTRKSTEDGLEQEFNSLDAQRDACSAYVMSQLHEGWTLISDHYDDGGFSGGTMDRPALRRLLADVAAKKVDVIVIYKIDRLTRSLMDFSKIVDVLDGAAASFVSVTQAFNTTTSMGRLTLNMLLSFAQFEREVTGERIRDKIAASKRKGLWMGGTVPLGYTVIDRRLAVNEPKAALVRHIMQRYLALGSVRELVEELRRGGWRTKIQQRVSGPHRGGCAFERGTIFHLLRNPIYRGNIVHKGAVYPGEHPAIVDEALWNAVQAALAERASGSAKRVGTHISLLAGMLTDGLGRPMTPTHASKPGRRYRYYCSRQSPEDEQPAWRVGASDLERLVLDQLASRLLDRRRIAELTTGQKVEPRELVMMLNNAENMIRRLRGNVATEHIALLSELRPRVQLFEDRIAVTVPVAQLLTLLGFNGPGEGSIELTFEAVRVRQGHEIKLVLPGQVQETVCRDEKLVALLSEAYIARHLVLANPDRSSSQIAKEAGRCRTRLSKLFMLSHLAPSIVTAILDGTQPRELTRKRLLEVDLPVAWSDQRKLQNFS